MCTGEPATAVLGPLPKSSNFFLVTVLTDNAWVENEGNQDPEDGESMRRTIMESLDGLTSFSISVTWIANANEKDIR